MIINGDLILKESSIESLGNLKEVKGELKLGSIVYRLKDLGKIEKLGAFNVIQVKNELIENLNYLKIVNSDLNLENFVKLKSLKNLKTVNGSLNLSNCVNLESLYSLEYVEKFINLSNCVKLTSLGKLKYINRNLLLENSKNLKSLGDINECDGNILLTSSGITKEYIEKEKPWLKDKCLW